MIGSGVVFIVLAIVIAIDHQSVGHSTVVVFAAATVGMVVFVVVVAVQVVFFAILLLDVFY